MVNNLDVLKNAMKKLKDNGDGNGRVVAEVDNSSPYPDRPGEPDCIHYLRTGTCSYGSNCRFNHPPYSAQGFQNSSELPLRDGQPECRYYLKTGTCRYGLTCRYHHPLNRNSGAPLLLNNLGLPMRKDEKPCSYYVRTGTCKFGVLCKFHHPQPGSAGNLVTGPPPVYRSNGLALPSSVAPYAGGVPKSSEFTIPETTYASNALQIHQTYMPVLLSPSRGWSTYMGTMSPSLITNVLSHPASNIPMHMSSTSVSQLPDRPDQPECRDFVNTGSCKYGLDCKYHHPRDKITPVASEYLGPLGLPLRPGQAVCLSYSMYGICKYGPACKYDHPIAGYLYNYNLGFPTVLPDPPAFPFQWPSPSVKLSETSPSKSSKYSDLPKKGDAAKKDEKYSDPTLENVPERGNF